MMDGWGTATGVIAVRGLMYGINLTVACVFCFFVCFVFDLSRQSCLLTYNWSGGELGYVMIDRLEDGGLTGYLLTSDSILFKILVLHLFARLLQVV